MSGKSEMTPRERKRENSKKTKTEFIYSSKHLRQQVKIMSQLKSQGKTQDKSLWKSEDKSSKKNK